MKKLIFLFVMFITLWAYASNVDAQTFRVEGNNYVNIKTSTRETKREKTGKTYTDKDGKVYDMYIRQDGRCYILKTSKNTGKEYSKNLDEDLSRHVCRELGKQYTYVKKSKS